LGQRPPGNGAGDVLHSGRGARLVIAEPARDWRCPRELSWHPSARGSTHRNSGSFWKSTGPNTPPRTCCADCGPDGCCGHVSAGTGTPPGCSTPPARVSGGRSPFALNDHRLPSANPAGWSPSLSSTENVQTPVASFGGEGWGEEAVTLPAYRCLPKCLCPSPRAPLGGTGRNPGGSTRMRPCQPRPKRQQAARTPNASAQCAWLACLCSSAVLC
jgi:hypothetical protein